MPFRWPLPDRSDQPPQISEFHELATRLASGQAVDEMEFDQIYAGPTREVSGLHWTPVSIARRAAEMLVDRPGMRVLDVGSGVGKFCMVGALSTSGIFTGVEQRQELVNTAQKLTDHYRVPRVQFECKNILDVPWWRYQAIYLYNPFSENLHSLLKIDDTVRLSPDLYWRYINFTETQLREAQSGTRVCLYHGFGGVMPTSYDLKRIETTGCSRLELWIKR